MAITANKVGSEPIPGYILRKRLGAGGYGEVWLADAPGGLQKAIKLIYGTVEQSHANSELKSLERIRQVNHPFLLSLERIEIVDGQVVIITELAEQSLLDRFEQHRRKGAPGIPRSELLELLGDTADALDFLVQKHSLQHLDIKPGNLLITADRVKVADFGLVKDLHDQNQSMVSGLTPTYSAPEMFDGRPDSRSDQYSLAIVYTEMLAGSIPFDGKTTAELARQHLNQAPNLEALPPADRAAVARALSKNPHDRFSTCKQFIDQLKKNRNVVIPCVGNNDKSSARVCNTELEKTFVNPVLNGKQHFVDRLDVTATSKEWATPHCMFIGLGSLGCESLLRLREQLHKNCDNRLAAEDHSWLAIDTTSQTLAAITDIEERAHLDRSQVMQLPVYKPAHYRQATPGIFEPLSRRWLYNIPNSLTTEGVRPLATLALIDHFEPVRAKVLSELEALIQSHEQDTECDEPLRIYLLTSMHGGTGSAWVCEMGLLIRQLMDQLGFRKYRICAAATVATVAGGGVANLPSAAAIACLSEMTYLMSGNQDIPTLYRGGNNVGSTRVQPFDWVTLVDGGTIGLQVETDAAAGYLAQVAFVDSQTMVGALLAESRREGHEHSATWLRASCADPIQLSNHISGQDLAKWCSGQALGHAARYMNGPRGMATSSVANEQQIGHLPATAGVVPLTPQACEEFTRRLLKDLGVIATNVSAQDLAAAEDGDQILSKWARRLSDNPELVTRQLAADLATWRESIARIVQMRVYNWRQVEQIQLNVIENLLDFLENETASLVKIFEPFTQLLGTPEQMSTAAARYLREFTEECVQMFGQFQSEGKTLSQKLRSWCSSVEAEKTFNSSVDVNVASLPSNIQLLANRVNSVLESILHREVLRIVDENSADVTNLPANLQDFAGAEVNLQFVLSIAQDLVPKTAMELGLDPSVLGQPEQEGGNVQLRQLDTYLPPIAQGGGRLSRFTIASVDQLTALEKSLAEMGLASTTTVVPGTRSIGTMVACDASFLNIANIISTLWRPTAATLQLAERLHTRIDIDWETVSVLLDPAKQQHFEMVDVTLEEEGDLNEPLETAGPNDATQTANPSPVPLPPQSENPAPLDAPEPGIGTGHGFGTEHSAGFDSGSGTMQLPTS